jgi:hypothetical protein
MRAIEQAAPSFAVEPIGAEVHDDAEIERAISAVAHEAGGGLIVMPDTFNMVHRRTTIGLAARHRLSAIYRSATACPVRPSRSRAIRPYVVRLDHLDIMGLLDEHPRVLDLV